MTGHEIDGNAMDLSMLSAKAVPWIVWCWLPNFQIANVTPDAMLLGARGVLPKIVRLPRTSMISSLLTRCEPCFEP